MDILKYILIIYLFIQIVISQDSDDFTCFQSLLVTLFGSSIDPTLFCGVYIHPKFYFSIGCVNNVISEIILEAYSEVLEPLKYDHLKCFKSPLNSIELRKIILDSQNTLGAANDREVAKTVILNNCNYVNGDYPISTVGNSISMGTKSLKIKVGLYSSNLKKINLSVFKYSEEGGVYYLDSLANYPEIVVDVIGPTVAFNYLYLTLTKVPNLSNIVVKQLNIELFQPNSDDAKYSFGNFATFNSVESLALYFQGAIEYPNYLSSSTNSFNSLTINGVLTVGADINSYELPPKVLYFRMVYSSPSFNINGKFPFKIPKGLVSLDIPQIGLKEFPTGIDSIQILSIVDNLFSTNLPDLSNYNSLWHLTLKNCGFIGSVPYSYGRIRYIDLGYNNLSEKLPQSIVCYKENYFSSFEGNPLLLPDDPCDINTIVPNLEYSSSSMLLLLYGDNLGALGPTIVDPQLVFLTDQNRGSFFLGWNEDSLGVIPDILQVLIGKRVYTLATSNLTPQFKNASRSSLNQYIFNGSNYSYNKTDFEVSISGIKGTIISLDFNTIIATFPDSSLPKGKETPSRIKNTKSGLYVDFTVDTSSDSISCSSDCGIADGRGSCDTLIGKCACSQKWTGSSCSTPNHFLTSASSTTTKGGTVNLFGWFGDSHDNIKVIIGSLNCPVDKIFPSFANCTIGAGTGTKSITIFQNGVTWVGENMFHYTETEYKCPNDCSSNGVCNKSTGQCRCYSGYGGYDCNSKTSIDPSTSTSGSSTTGGIETPAPTLSPIEIPKSNTTINDTTGSTTISNQQTSYEISILSLVELDILDNIVLVHNLTNKWTSEEILDNIYTFKQTIQDSCSITYSIEDVKEPREYTFAGLQLSLDKDSIKITVKIENYPFTSALNKLQLRIESSAGEINNSGENLNNQCNNKETQIDSSGLDKDQLLNYITISKNEKVLYGRFINRALSDTRESFITTTLISNTTSTIDNKESFIIGLNLPFFINNLTIDPDFSVLTSVSFKKCNSDGSKNERASWVIPVSIVVPCVVVAGGIILGSIIYRKNRTTVLMVKQKINLKGLSKRKEEELYLG